MIGADYSLARPSGVAFKAAGYTWVARYLCSYGPKRLSCDERDDLFNNGLAIVLLFEDDAMQALNGYNQGVLDAQEALQQANDLGVPATVPIHFTVDFDATVAQQTLIDAYFQGAISVLGLDRVGAYGGYWVLLRLGNAGLITYKFQTIAWSGGNMVPGINIYQDGIQAFNGGVDEDVSETTNFGQWSKNQGEDMVNTQADADLLYASTLHTINPDSSKTLIGLNFETALKNIQSTAEWQTQDKVLNEYMPAVAAELGVPEVSVVNTIKVLQQQLDDLAKQPPASPQIPTPVSETTVSTTTTVETPPASEPVVVVTSQQNFLIRFIKWLFK